MLNFERITYFKNRVFLGDYNITRSTLREDEDYYYLDFSLELTGDLSTISSLLHKKDEKIKIKVFYIGNEEFSSALENIHSISVLNDILKNNKIESIDINVCYDFIGDKTDITKHLKNNIYCLRYERTLQIKKNSKDISLGLMFYHDPVLYSLENKIPISYIQDSILSSNIKIEKMMSNGKDISINNSFKNLSSINKILESNKKLNEFFDSLNFNSLLSFNEKKINASNRKNPIFSDIMYSSDNFGNLNFISCIDYKKIIENNSKYINILKNINDEVRNNILENSIISSFKILRRRYKKIDKYNKNNILVPNSTKTLIETSQKNISMLIPNSTDRASISEMVVFKKMKTVEVVDKEVYKTSPGLYQYGASISFRDGFYYYINNIKNMLIENSLTVKKYLNETTNPKNYDFINEVFISGFVDSEFKKIYEKDIVESISVFLTALSCLNITSSEEIEQSKKSILACLHPSSCNSTTISIFINLYEKFIHSLEKLLLYDKEENKQVEFWFKSLVDTDRHPSYGYGYLHKQNKEGLLKVTSRQLISKIFSDATYFSSNTDSLLSLNQNIFSISPSYVKMGSDIINFSTLNNLDYTSNISSIITDNLFTNLELNIRKYKLNSQTSNMYHAAANIDRVLNSDKETIFNTYSELLNGMSVEITNLHNHNSDINAKKNGVSRTANLNINVDSFILSLLNTKISKSTSNDNGYIPFQLLSLSREKSTSGSISIKKDTNSISNFLLLHNTVAKIMYLDNNINSIDQLKDSKWREIDTPFIDSMGVNDNVVCKLVVYQNKNIEIDSYEQISLPIYDELFLLQKSDTSFTQQLARKLPRIIPQRKNNVVPNSQIATTNQKIASTIQINTNAKAISTPVPPRRISAEEERRLRRRRF